MISIRAQILLLLAALTVAAGGLFIPAPATEEEIRFTVCAAAGTEKLAAALATDAFGGNNRGLVVEAGSTAELRRRLAHGHRADLLIAADDENVAALGRLGRLAPTPPVPVVEIPLVVVIPAAAPPPPHQPVHLLTPSVRSIAVGGPGSELGRTTEAALKELGLWFKLLPRLRPCRSAAIAVHQVQRGHADAAIVFAPDAGGVAGIRVLAQALPPESYRPVRIVARMLAATPDPQAAHRFLAHLGTPLGRARIAAYRQGKFPPLTPDRRTRFWSPLLLSLRAACFALMLVAPLAIAAAAGLAHLRRRRIRRVIEALLNLPLVLPPVAVGYGLLLALAPGGPVQRLTGLPLGFTWQAAALAAAVVAFPLAFRPALRAFDAVDPRDRKVAPSLGGGRLTAFMAVTLPLSGRGVAAGAVLAFARAFGEFGATLIVAGNIPRLTRTLPQALLTESEAGDSGIALALLAVALLVAFAATLASAALERHSGADRSRPA